MSSSTGAIVAIASSGGHLSQAIAVAESMPGSTVRIVTDEGFVGQQEARERGWALLPKVGRSPRKHLTNALRQFLLLAKLRPALLLSTGSGWCLPAIAYGRVLGYPTVFIESFSRVTAPSKFGELAYLLAEKTLVQWPELLQIFPRATAVQPVFMSNGHGREPTGAGTFVSVGTHHTGMDRLVQAVDELAAAGAVPAPVLMQIGAGSYEPRNAEWVRSLTRKEFATQIEGSRLVVAHAGAGVMGQCIQAGKRPVVVPRDPEEGEIVDGHQYITARRLEAEGLVIVCDNLAALRESVVKVTEKGGDSGMGSLRTSILDLPTAAQAIAKWRAA